MCWNTAHLLKRTLLSLQKQTISQEWELLIIDDRSEDDIPAVLATYGVGLPIRYHRLEHDMGMRGNTAAINYGVEQAQGRIVMWSTPEVMLPPGALAAVLAAHTDEHLFVTIPSHGLTVEMQLRIDKVNWRKDFQQLVTLADPYPEGHWNSLWFWLNFYNDGMLSHGKRSSFGNNQTVAVNRDYWRSSIKKFPLFLDYGTDDPWLAGHRGGHGFRDLTLWDQPAYHQWHTRAQYWMAQGKAPMWNKWGHTTHNFAQDPEVPMGGTCEIWDHGDHSPLSEAEATEALKQRDMVLATGWQPVQS